MPTDKRVTGYVQSSQRTWLPPRSGSRSCVPSGYSDQGLLLRGSSVSAARFHPCPCKGNDDHFANGLFVINNQNIDLVCCHSGFLTLAVACGCPGHYKAAGDNSMIIVPEGSEGAASRVPAGLFRPPQYAALPAARSPWRAGSNPGLIVLTGFQAG